MSTPTLLQSGHSEEDVSECVDWKLPLSFVKKRHTENIEGESAITQTWRMKERMKTVSVALVLCLNVGVDPPDIVKTQPCARLECWIDPLSMSPQKALETIGGNLQKQYEKWQPRARYKQSLDPTVEEVKRLCTSLRRNAKDERVLFHYNGHGVPKPTTNGEIWVFNRTYTQYIPLSIFDLQTCMGTPSIYVYDCSNAGAIVSSFKQFAEQHEKEYEMAAANQNRGNTVATPSFKNCIQLASCAGNQVLPMNPDLPADIFTSCLTTPIKIALRWFVMQTTSKLVPKITIDLIDRIPGQLNDRRTMLGELNWIFTAITDTIAWNTLPRDLFQKLFRQDLLVASLFRNFLLAERIMRSYDCTPVSSPKLPSTHQHPMWQAWDLALDLCLAQLPGILDNDEPFVHSPFFEEQLTAFQVWLDLGGEHRNPPEQLPIVLQVLLSQVHRLRALELLGRFLDLGPWAVNLALSVGIFPYVLKLLQSSARELRPLLVFIWAKILAVDSTCQADLVRENGHKYFLSVLQDNTVSSEHRTLSAFVLASIVNNYQAGQEAGLQGSLVSICLEQLNDPNPRLRQWVSVCLARLWTNYDRARWCGVRDIAHEKLYDLLQDSEPEVRAAAVYALGTFISSVLDRTEHANSIDHSVATMLLNTVSLDMSPLVRQELIVALQWMVLLFENSFISVALAEEYKTKESPLSPNFVIVNDLIHSPQSGLKRIASRDRLGKLLPSAANYEGMGVAVDLLPTSSIDRMKRVSSSSSINSLGYNQNTNLHALPFGSIYTKLWCGLNSLENDPYPGVQKMARVVVERIREQVSGKEAQVTNKDVHEAKTSSVSLPPSPSSRTSYLTEESPPSLITASDLNKLAIRSATHISLKVRKNLPNTINEETDESSATKKPIVSTQFVEWSSKYFAQPIMGMHDENDLESKSYYEKEWRYLRNASLRNECREEQKKILNGRLEHQIFNSRSQDSPSVIMFHPYETHLAVAAKDNYGFWDWNTGSKLCYWPNKATKGSRITAMQFVNAHDVTLLLNGSDDGTVRLWSNYLARENREPELVTAWQALSDVTPANKSVNGNVGIVMVWQQHSQELVVAGDTTKIRFWDAEKELKIVDLHLGVESCVTSISSDPSYCNLVAVGCADGSVRLFDRRLAPQDARVMTWREHSSWVVGVHLKAKAPGEGRLISGCFGGDVRFFDLRKNTSVGNCQTSHGMNTMAVHNMTEIFCCGSVNQFISVYKTLGTELNVIKYHEGFMGSRIGSVSCLSLHPYRVALAAGSADCTLSVFAGDPKSDSQNSVYETFQKSLPGILVGTAGTFQEFSKKLNNHPEVPKEPHQDFV